MRLIPTEIVVHILKELDDEKDLIECTHVCRQWSYHALEQLWINLAPLASLVNDTHIASLANCQRLERLTLANCFHITDVGLCNLIDVRTGIGPELVSIDLTDVLNVTDKTILKIAICCPRLQGLNLSMSRPHFDITDVGIVALAQQCPELKRIKLNNCVTITEKSSIALALYCPYLVEVDLMNCGVTDRTLQALFSHCRDLRELRLNQCDAAESLLTERVFLDSALANNPNYYEQLRLVDLTGISSINDHSIAILVEAAPRIRSLVLNKCFKVTDEGILSVCKLGRYLHYLHLGHCSQITDRSITKLATECNRIRYLDMACCIDITDKSVVELAKNLTKLKRIGLVKCSNITDAAIQALSYHSMSLERVHLSYCVKLTVPAITRLLHRCRYLNHLSLTHVPAFLREDYQQFCRPPPSEFTELQRQTFCVYSGKGVQDIRNYLLSLYD
ncbi:SCF ubiquitin ligase complex subunit [Rhizopus azygosporus]|uniref:SCF ubiquitin ligase complex subunit n=1 Tax=Rhizopus azygosporus TaxID=86630 RepID=A0A367J4G5_RHIAZ|nr:SCF ubiquitin ligase complex subunit [Rhizopus azygosporus]